MSDLDELVDVDGAIAIDVSKDANVVDQLGDLFVVEVCGEHHLSHLVQGKRRRRRTPLRTLSISYSRVWSSSPVMPGSKARKNSAHLAAA